MNYEEIANIKWPEFRQVAESYGQDREALKGIRSALLLKKQDIELQIDARDQDGRGDPDYEAWRFTATRARDHVTKKTMFVDGLLSQKSKASSHAGHLLRVHGPKKDEWVISSRPPQDWQLDQLREFGEEAREFSIHLALNQTQWEEFSKCEGVTIE